MRCLIVSTTAALLDRRARNTVGRRVRRVRIAGNVVAAERNHRGTGAVIGRHLRGAHGRGAAPVGGKTTWLAMVTFMPKPATSAARAEETLLYQVIDAYYPDFIAQLPAEGRTLPRFVRREFADYLKCGRLEHGFLRVCCTACHAEKLVAFSGKRRGFCASCGARRMVESAALRVDEVLPEAPLRQWVWSVPFALRFLFRTFAEKFGNGQVSALTTSNLQSWRDRLVSQPAANADITDSKRRDRLRASQGTANRVWAICRAALNHAFRTGRVDSDLAWRRIQRFQDVDEARKRFLSVAEANKLLGACKGRFRDPVQAALLTGLRPGELVRLTVGQFHGTRLEVSAGKTGKSRFVPLTTQGVAVFKKLTKSRSSEDLMLPNAELKSWTRMQIARAMRDAVIVAKLETPAVFYDLRRS
jgi:site-specific recombinase XerD